MPRITDELCAGKEVIEVRFNSSVKSFSLCRMNLLSALLCANINRESTVEIELAKSSILFKEELCHFAWDHGRSDSSW